METNKQALQGYGLNLTKWGSSHKKVIEVFDPEDRAKGLQNLYLQNEELPTDKALCLTWNLEIDKRHISEKIKDTVLLKGAF